MTVVFAFGATKDLLFLSAQTRQDDTLQVELTDTNTHTAYTPTTPSRSLRTIARANEDKARTTKSATKLEHKHAKRQDLPSSSNAQDAATHAPRAT